MKDEKITGFWVFLSWTVFLILITSVIGYNGLYGQDSYEYLRYCGRLFEFMSKGIPPGDYFWPVNYPLLGGLLSFITGSQIALQLLSIISASWILYLICMFLLREFPGREREVIVYVILFLGLSPYFFRYAISSMSDVLALAFACTAFYALYIGIKHHCTGWLYSTWFFASMAVFTRFALLPLVVPVVLLSCHFCFKRINFSYLFIAVFAAVIPPFIFVYFKQNNATDIFHHFLVTDWSLFNLFKSSFITIDGISNYVLPNIIFVFSFLVHPGFIFPGILFLILLVKKRSNPSLLYPVAIIGVILYLLFIAGLPSRNIRYLIPVIPFYLIFCFPGFLVLLSWLYKRKNIRAVVFASAVLVQVLLTIKAFIPFYELNRLEKLIAEKIIDYHPQVVYTFGIDGALRNYGYHGMIINLWDQRLDSVRPDALMLFNKQKNAKQWSGKNPMLNYEFIVDKAQSLKIEDIESGWEIYEVKKAYPATYTGVPPE